MIMLNLAHVPPPAAALRSTQPPMIRALVGHKTLPIATRLDIAERGEALAIIEATRLGDLYVEAVRDGAALPPAMARARPARRGGAQRHEPRRDHEVDRRGL